MTPHEKEIFTKFREFLIEHNALDIFCKAVVDPECYALRAADHTIMSSSIIMDMLIWSSTTRRYGAMDWSGMDRKWYNRNLTDFHRIPVNAASRKEIAEFLLTNKLSKNYLLKILKNGVGNA